MVGNFSSPMCWTKTSLIKSKRREKESCPQNLPGLQSLINNLPQLLNSWNSVWRPASPPGETQGILGNLCLIFVGRRVAIGHHVFDRRRSKEFQGKPPRITFLEELGRGERSALAKCRVLGIFQGMEKLGCFLVWMFYGVYLKKFFVKCA